MTNASDASYIRTGTCCGRIVRWVASVASTTLRCAALVSLRAVIAAVYPPHHTAKRCGPAEPGSRGCDAGPLGAAADEGGGGTRVGAEVAVDVGGQHGAAGEALRAGGEAGVQRQRRAGRFGHAVVELVAPHLRAGR